MIASHLSHFGIFTKAANKRSILKNFNKKRLQLKCFPVNLTKLLRIPLL